jgi:hypothetical protein
MKKLGIQIALLCVLIITTILVIVLLPPRSDGSFMLSIVDKHRILENTKSPKIVLAGGSNAAVGIDSAEIQNVFHIPAVNISVSVGIGLGRILDDVSPFLNNGDILIIAPEYDHFTNFWNGRELAFDLIFITRQFRMLWSPNYYDLPRNFNAYILYRLKAAVVRYLPLNSSLPSPRYDFNEYGDNVRHLTMESHPSISPAENIGTVNKKYLASFFRFVDEFTARGITVVLSYPSYETESFNNSAAEIAELDAAFRAKENLKVISNPKDYAFPAGLFFDSYYHLNAEGRALRTKQLIEDLGKH